MGNCRAAKRPKGEASAIRERRSSSATATIMPAIASWLGLGRWWDSGVLKRGTRPSEVVNISVESWPRGLGFRRMGGSESGRAAPVRADWERLGFFVVLPRFGLEGTPLLEGWGVLAGGRGSWSCQSVVWEGVCQVIRTSLTNTFEPNSGHDAWSRDILGSPSTGWCCSSKTLACRFSAFWAVSGLGSSAPG